VHLSLRSNLQEDAICLQTHVGHVSRTCTFLYLSPIHFLVTISNVLSEFLEKLVLGLDALLHLQGFRIPHQVSLCSRKMLIGQI
jgi:hypothetical protein